MSLLRLVEIIRAWCLMSPADASPFIMHHTNCTTWHFGVGAVSARVMCRGLSGSESSFQQLGLALPVLAAVTERKCFGVWVEAWRCNPNTLQGAAASGLPKKNSQSHTVANHLQTDQVGEIHSLWLDPNNTPILWGGSSCPRLLTITFPTLAFPIDARGRTWPNLGEKLKPLAA